MTPYTNASSETGNDALSSGEGKRNRKTQALSALLSATALGAFLEGCGGGTTGGGGGASGGGGGGGSRAQIAGIDPEAFDLSDTYEVSYKDSPDVDGDGKGVKVDLSTGIGSGEYADGDTFNTGTVTTDTKSFNLIGSDFNDELIGDAGENILEGGAYDDILSGGAGIDTYIFESGHGTDTIQGDTEAGNKIYLRGVTDPYSLVVEREQGGDVRIDTGNEDSVLIKADSISMGRYDIYYGENDELFSRLVVAIRTGGELGGGAAQDWMVGSVGADTLNGLGGNDYLVGGADGDTLSGGADEDLLYGDSGNDDLRGNTGDDELYGGDGDDILNGGGGSDILHGGAGADTYILLGGLEDTDIIRGDAEAGNKIYFRHLDSPAAIDELDVTREENGDASFVFGTHSLTIEADSYAHGRYIGYYSAADTEVGRLSIAETGGESITAASDDEQDWMIGSRAVDTLSGGGGGDRLEGGGGDDFLYGNAGNDNLRGNEGGDELYGGDGDDKLDGGADNDILHGGAGADTYIITSGGGADTIRGDAEAGNKIYFRDLSLDAIRGIAATREANGDVSFVSGENSLTIEADSYAQGRYSAHYGASDMEVGKIAIATVEGGILNADTGGDIKDFMIGLEGDDILDGLGGDDTLVGGAGGDTLKGSEGNDILYGDAGSDTLEGGRRNDELYGGTEDDFLYGNEENDILHGGAGSDTLDGGAGADTYILLGGREDTDTIQGDDSDLATTTNNIYLRHVSNAEGISFVRDTETATLGDVIFTAAGGHNTVIKVSSYAHGRYIVHYGNDAENRDTPLGRLSIAAAGGETIAAASDGGQDWMIGSEGVDTLSGGGGNDRIYGRGGVDTLAGGTGDDNLYGGGGADTLRGGADNDLLEGGAGDDTLLDGGAGNDELRGGGGADTLDGGVGADFTNYADAGEGVRVNLALTTAQTDFDGTEGFTANQNDAVGDTLSNIENIRGSGHNDWLTGDGNANIINGNAGHDRIEGGGAADTLRGNDGDDNLYGEDGEDTLTGGEGTDTLVGGTGADTLTGGEGADILDGGVGGDTYVFESGHGTDTIQGDISGVGNQIHFRHLDSVAAVRGLDVTREEDGDVRFVSGADSLTIKADSFADGRYSVYYGTSNTEVGQITLAVTAGSTLGDDSTGDIREWMIGSVGDDTFAGGGGGEGTFLREAVATTYSEVAQATISSAVARARTP